MNQSITKNFVVAMIIHSQNSTGAKAFPHILQQIGNRLTELRRQKGYTSHEAFAYDHDLPRIQYWRMEKGKANFTIRSLMKVLAIHNLSVEKFFESLRKD